MDRKELIRIADSTNRTGTEATRLKIWKVIERLALAGQYAVEIFWKDHDGLSLTERGYVVRQLQASKLDVKKFKESIIISWEAE